MEKLFASVGILVMAMALFVGFGYTGAQAADEMMEKGQMMMDQDQGQMMMDKGQMMMDKGMMMKEGMMDDVTLPGNCGQSKKLLQQQIKEDCHGCQTQIIYS